jgi:hypothetical protein
MAIQVPDVVISPVNSRIQLGSGNLLYTIRSHRVESLVFSFPSLFHDRRVSSERSDERSCAVGEWDLSAHTNGAGKSQGLFYIRGDLRNRSIDIETDVGPHKVNFSP